MFLRGTDYIQKSLDGIFFSFHLCIMNIEEVYKHSTAFFTVVTKDTLYRCCSISVCCQRVNLLLLFHPAMFYVASFHKNFCKSTVIKR